MPEQKPQELLIIKRSRDSAHPHHGGAWKIAFADFMTAMMALFLVLWLINATNQKTKASLARYFNPVDLVDMSTLQRGVRDPSDGIVTDGTASNQHPTNKTPQQSKDGKALPASGGAAQKGDAKTAQPDKATQTRTMPSSATDPDTKDQYVAPAERPPTYTETALFRDPYAVLAKIAASNDAVAAAGNSGSSSSADADAGSAASFKDPFKNTMPNTLTNAAAATPPSPIAQPIPAAPPKVTKPATANGDAAATASQPPQSPPKPVAMLMQQAGTTQSASALPSSPHSTAAAKPQPNDGPQSADDTQQLKKQIAGLVGAAAKGDASPNIEVKVTDEGVLIRLMDESNYAMFAIGSAQPEPKTVRVMEKIAHILRTQKGMIVISGHTDGRPYKSATYDNWRLSSARAQMAYYMLVRGGLDAKRIERIEGYADRDLKEPKNPLADDNRRIEIFLRKGKP